MKFEHDAKDTRFICTKNELGYQEVIDDFPNTNSITIITYNISEKNNELFNFLESAKEDCEINILTNIPSRWNTYYKDTFRLKAKAKINVYLSKLDPNRFGDNFNVFFNFSNHGKIIMTDNVVYVGSANFSSESKNNLEFGFISKDTNLINYLYTELLPEIQSASIPYFEYDYTSLSLEGNLMASAIFELRNELHLETYKLHDDFDGEWFYYDYNNDLLSSNTIDAIKKILREALDIVSEMYDAIDIITKSDENELDLICHYIDNLTSIYDDIEKISSNDSIYELSKFDINEYINNILQKEFSMEATEEYLEKCIDKSSDIGYDRLNELNLEAKPFIDELLSKMKEFLNEYNECIEYFCDHNIIKINPSIDNT